MHIDFDSGREGSFGVCAIDGLLSTHASSSQVLPCDALGFAPRKIEHGLLLHLHN